MSNRLAEYKKSRAVQSRKREEKAVEVKSKRNERFMKRRALSEVTVQSQDEDIGKQPKRTIRTTRLTKAREEELLKWREKREVQKAKEREDSKKHPPFLVGKFTLGESTVSESLATKVKKPAKVTKPAKRKMSTRFQNKAVTLDTPLESTSTVSEEGPLAKTTPERPAISESHHAWIPGATLPTPKATKSFNELFPTEFSPFKFTGTSDKYLKGGQFTFQKELDDPMEEEPSDGEEEMDTSHCNEGAVTERGVVRSDDSVEIINHSILHNHEVTNTINELETKQSQSNTDEEEVAPEQASEFSYYRQLYDVIIAKFTALCEEWEGKEEELQSSGEASSEVCDQIRITACQARLLMRSKLKQYIGLVAKAEDPSETIPTTAEDLQGFWDMMYLQISGIEAKFASLAIMEENRWEEIEEKVEKKKVTKLRKKRRVSRGRPKTPSDKLKSDRAKREEQRRLMKEKILAAKKNKRKSINASPAAPPTSGSGMTPPPLNELETNQSQSNVDEEEVAPEQASEFSYYRQLYDDIIAKFTALCEEWEGKEEELQSSGEASSEVCDQIRITACQARLLMRSKLKQYIGLVAKAEDPSETIPTTAEDLQGFWDMMYLQISGIEAKFASLAIMEENGWEEIEEKVEKKKVTKLRKKRRVSRGRPKTPSDKLKSDRAKREEQRRLMKEKIMAAKKNKRKSINASPTAPPTSGSGLTPPPSKATDPLTTNNEDLIATGNLVSLTPAKTPVKLSKRKSMSLLKRVLTSSSSESDCGSMTTLVKIEKPSKKLVRELGSDSDVIMSPARRSIRIQRMSMGVTPVKQSLQRKSVGVAPQDPMEFIRDLPDNAECVIYKPIESHI